MWKHLPLEKYGKVFLFGFDAAFAKLHWPVVTQTVTKQIRQ